MTDLAERPVGALEPPPIHMNGRAARRPLATRQELAAMVMLGVLVPVLLVPLVHTRMDRLNLALLIALIVWTSIALVRHGASRPTRFATTMFYVFCYVFVALASWAQAVPSAFPLDGLDYSQSLITQHLLALAIGIVAFEVGRRVATLVARRQTEADRPARQGGTLTLSPGRILTIAAIGLLVDAYYVASYGPLAFFVSRQQTGNILAGVPIDAQLYLTANKAGGLLRTFLAQYFVFVALYLILYARRRGLWSPSETIGTLGWRIVIALLVVANVIINNPIGNGRYWFCLLGVCFATVWLPPYRRSVVVLLAGGAVSVLALAFSALDRFRDTSVPAGLVQQSGLLSGDYPILQTGLNGEAYVLTYGHTYGRQMLGSLLGFVPRQVWPDKPIDTGQLIDPQYARSATSWTEISVDFGIAGIVVLFLLWGAAAYAGDRRLASSVPGAVPALLILVATFQIFLLRGSWLSGFATLYQLAFLIVVAMTRARPPDAAEPS